MNAANIVAIVVAFIAMLGTALTLWVNRTDRATKLNRENMDAVLKDSRVLRAFRDDQWAWENWARKIDERDRLRDARDRAIADVFHDMQVELQSRGALTHIRDLPTANYGPMPQWPDSEVRKLERQI